MKKITILLFCLFVVSGLFANPIDTLIAKQVAVNWFAERNTDFRGNEIKINEIITVNEKSEDLFYILNFANNNGYIIVSADDDVIPVLAYSFEYNYTNENHPPAYDYWLDTYKEQILYIKENKIKAEPEIKAEWNKLNVSTDNFPPVKGIKDVSPLLKTEWNQGSGWNSYCPTDVNGQGGHVWAGCVATAMAQIMKYWNYPTNGSGSHSYSCNYGTLSANFGATEYDWWSMDNYSATMATALLMYHCGVAVNMDYGANGSGAYVYYGSNDAYHAFYNYFGYTVSGRDGDLSDSEARSNIDAGQPILYSGANSSGNEGHAFVLDGYQGSNYFHFNWGWSGYYNGYFYLNNLTPGSYNFSYYNTAVFNIHPDVSCNLVLSNANTTGNHEATCSITLSPGFSTGGNFRARIIPGDAKNGVKISFTTPCHGQTKLIIYDKNNNKITTLINQYLFKDDYEFYWDKTNDKGEVVKNGNYYYKLITIKGVETKEIQIE